MGAGACVSWAVGDRVQGGVVLVEEGEGLGPAPRHGAQKTGAEDGVGVLFSDLPWIADFLIPPAAVRVRTTTTRAWSSCSSFPPAPPLPT